MGQREKERMQELERRIDQGMVRGGAALKLARDNETYRPMFDTFEEYCQKVLGFDLEIANIMIQASEARNEGT